MDIDYIVGISVTFVVGVTMFLYYVFKNDKNDKK